MDPSPRPWWTDLVLKALEAGRALLERRRLRRLRSKGRKVKIKVLKEDDDSR